MVIHVVQSGENIYSIAKQYGVLAGRLIRDNDLKDPYNLVVGQTIVIVYPTQIYMVMEGDSLAGIADAFGVTIRQLLRNNPFLVDRKFIYPGETIVISYHTNKGRMVTDGYAFPFIDHQTLRKTLPFLSYLSIFNYRVTAEAEIISTEDDTAIIQLAKEFGVAPIMVLSTLTIQGEGSLEIANDIIYNVDLITRLIDNILSILNEKGYYGLNITLQYLTERNQLVYDAFIRAITTRLNGMGYPVSVTLTPRMFFDINQITFERIEYSELGSVANSVTIMSYNWGYSFGPPAATTSVFMTRQFLDYAITMIPPEKILVGLPTIGYDWEIPYTIGISRAVSLNTDSAVALAGSVGVPIGYDEISQAAFFQYIDYNGGSPKYHIVWFKDARSIDAIAGLVPEYGVQGLSIWNIMHYFTQMWLVINSQYEIVTVLDQPIDSITTP